MAAFVPLPTGGATFSPERALSLLPERVLRSVAPPPRTPAKLQVPFDVASPPLPKGRRRYSSWRRGLAPLPSGPSRRRRKEKGNLSWRTRRAWPAVERLRPRWRGALNRAARESAQRCGSLLRALASRCKHGPRCRAPRRDSCTRQLTALCSLAASSTLRGLLDFRRVLSDTSSRLPPLPEEPAVEPWKFAWPVVNQRRRRCC